MDALTLVAAFWISGIGMAMYTLYLPAVQIIGRIDKNNLAYRYAWIGGVAFVFFVALSLPFMIHIILLEKHQEKFLRSFIPAYMGEK
jgi:uncharacterized membrane protein YdcZ (DUF606 family)